MMSLTLSAGDFGGTLWELFQHGAGRCINSSPQEQMLSKKVTLLRVRTLQLDLSWPAVTLVRALNQGHISPALGKVPKGHTRATSPSASKERIQGHRLPEPGIHGTCPGNVWIFVSVSVLRCLHNSLSQCFYFWK